MFLFQLEPDEQQAFLTLAYRLSAVDGVDPRETDRLNLFENETGKSLDDSDQRSVEELCAVFESRRSRMSAMIELVAISFADEEQTDQELDLLAKIGSELGLEKSDVSAATDWIIRQRQLISEAEILWEDA